MTIGVFSAGLGGVLSGIVTEALGGGVGVGIMVAILLPDAMARWDRVMEEEHEPPGFYEWLWRRP